MKLKVNFQLKPGETSNIQVLAFINYGYKEYDLLKRKDIYRPIILFTGMKVQPEEWNKVTKRPNVPEKIARLDIIRIQIEGIYNFLKLKGEFTRDEFKQEIEEKIKGKEVQKKVEKVRIVDFIRDHIMTSERLREGSKKPYGGFANKLEAYEKRIGKIVYSSDVDETMFLDFMDLMRTKVGRINTVWGLQKVFKTILNEISRMYKIEVFNPSKELANKDKVQSETSDSIYLNMEQIQTIINNEPKEERLRNVKFIFMILLFTGCRESDVYKIKPESAYNKGAEKFNYVRYIAQKTGTEIIVPILKPLQKMFDQNKGNPPRKISQQKFNEWVKELVLKCKMSDDVTTSYTDTKGNKQLVTKKLYQFVSSHTGRRSFITNLINFIPIPTLTKITGHALKDKSIIFAYNKMSLLENVVMFRKWLKRACNENKEYFPFELI